MLATQTLMQKKAKNMRVTVDGKLPDGVTAKDIILAIIGEIGTAGGTGHVIEYAGEAIRALSMEGRMTVCNMSIEGGARAGMVAPDEKTFAYLKGRPEGAQGRRLGHGDEVLGDAAHGRGRALRQRGQARRRQAAADRHLGHLARGRRVHRRAWCPTRPRCADEGKRASMARALEYMGLTPGTKITDIPLDVVFIGSCTNGRIEDLRAVAKIVEGKKVSRRLAYAMIVPGSGLVKEQAEAEGLDKIFLDAGFDWREPGCSMCLGMNPDQLKPARALRLDLEPQLRGPPGPPRPHAPGVARHGGGRGDRRPLRGRAQDRVRPQAVIPGLVRLVPGIHPPACSGVRCYLDPGNACRDDSVTRSPPCHGTTPRRRPAS